MIILSATQQEDWIDLKIFENETTVTNELVTPSDPLWSTAQSALIYAPDRYYNGTAWVLRPTIPAFTQNNRNIRMTGAAVGSYIVVYDKEIEREIARVSVQSTQFNIVLNDVGVYGLTVFAPEPSFPYRSINVTVIDTSDSYTHTGWITPTVVSRNSALVTAIQSQSTYTFENFNLVADSATNTVSWAAGSVIRNTGTVSETKTTTEGNRTWIGTGTLYLVYDWDNNEILDYYDYAELFTSPNRRLFAQYRGGDLLTQGVIIDGDRIIAGSIGAAQIAANEVIISGTAQIATAAIETANIKDLTVERIKISSGAITDQGVYTVYPSSGVAMDFLTSNPSEFIDLSEEVLFYCQNPAPEKIILEPSLFGSDVTLQVNPPTGVDGYFQTWFYQEYRLSVYPDEELNFPIYNTSRSYYPIRQYWQDQRLVLGWGVDSQSNNVGPIQLFKGVDYEDGSVLAMRIRYQAYTSEGIACSITRYSPGFGFTWRVFWK